MKEINQQLKKALHNKLHDQLGDNSKQNSLHKKAWLKKALPTKDHNSTSPLFTLSYIVPGILSCFFLVVILKNFTTPYGNKTPTQMNAIVAYHSGNVANLELRAELDEIITGASIDYADENDAFNEILNEE